MARYIHFDWAMKRMLRDKANFDVLEGFLTTLLDRKIKIEHLLESEGNKEHETDKFNRVDIIARDEEGETYIIEIQNTYKLDYFHRMLYGVSKFVTENISQGQQYDNVKKIYSINIVYFEIGQGKDYVYHGYTEFRGINDNNDILRLSLSQIESFGAGKSKARLKPGDLMPEYYILRVEDFDKKAVTFLDEWISFLKTGDIPETARAPGLPEARNKLILDQMSEDERRVYLQHIEDKDDEYKAMYSNLAQGRAEGHAEGEAIGLQKGEAIGLQKGEAIGLQKGIEQTVITGYRNGFSVEQIEVFCGLSQEQILEIIKSHKDL
ncbi:MAG: Rpn family recombination-promoting nuclease/putative transposase [Prevotellaceae bacterium]|jgi:predicted transposase/invertase (TIGR01784 family)|nr:Rpn family recombination-promoting nuclease/putative transposase [Prevotellaceae bacterium]